MKKKIFCLLLLLIMPVLLLSGCRAGIIAEEPSIYTYSDMYSDKVFLVKIQDNNNEWVEYADINKYVLEDNIGLVYIYRNNGEIIVTHFKNVIIYCK